MINFLLKLLGDPNEKKVKKMMNIVDHINSLEPEFEKLTDNEWKAIQSGAITENVLKEILNNADMDVIKQKAMPRQTANLSAAKINKITSMHNSGKTIAQIADALGVSTSTVSNYLRGKE